MGETNRKMGLGGGVFGPLGQDLSHPQLAWGRVGRKVGVAGQSQQPSGTAKGAEVA